jgi:hypothetical protein
VRQHTARIVFELVPLRQKIIAAVITNFIYQIAVRVADFADVGRKNHHLAALGDRRLHLVHPFGPGPEIVVEFGHDGEHAPEGFRYVNYMLFGREGRGRLPSLLRGAEKKPCQTCVRNY